MEFWNQLAPHHAALENNFFDLRSARALLEELVPPVLIVGAGQGLIVSELLQRGIACDGVDVSPEMIRYAKQRRGLTLINANALALPFQNQTYGSIIYATGVIDFTADEQTIHRMLAEGRRVLQQPGKSFVAFYRFSNALEQYLEAVGLLKDGILDHKGSLKTYLLNPLQTVRWIAQRTNSGILRATTSFLKVATLTSTREKIIAFRMQKVFRDGPSAARLIECAPQYQPYRNKPGIEALFARLSLPIQRICTLPSCFIVEI